MLRFHSFSLVVKCTPPCTFLSHMTNNFITNNFWKNYRTKLPCSNMNVHRESNTGPPSSKAWCHVHLAVRYCDTLSSKIIKQVYISEFRWVYSDNFFWLIGTTRCWDRGSMWGQTTFSFLDSLNALPSPCPHNSGPIQWARGDVGLYQPPRAPTVSGGRK